MAWTRWIAGITAGVVLAVRGCSMLRSQVLVLVLIVDRFGRRRFIIVIIIIIIVVNDNDWSQAGQEGSQWEQSLVGSRTRKGMNEGWGGEGGWGGVGGWRRVKADNIVS